MKYFEEIDCTAPEFGDLYDELPLWSAPFGRMLLEQRLNSMAAKHGELSLTIPAACIQACKPAVE